MEKERVSLWLRDLRKDRLVTAVKSKFPSVAAFARAVGRPSPAVTHHTNGTRTFEMEDAVLYASKLRPVTAEYLMGFDAVETEMLGVEVMGEAAFATWSDPKIKIERNENASRLYVPNMPNLKGRFAIRVLDASVNRAIPEGEFAICVGVKERDLVEGHLVYIEYMRLGLVQRTIRLVSCRPKGGFALKTLSTQTQFTSSLNFPSERKDESIKLLGRVVGRYGEIDLIQI